MNQNESDGGPIRSPEIIEIFKNNKVDPQNQQTNHFSNQKNSSINSNRSVKRACASRISRIWMQFFNYLLLLFSFKLFHCHFHVFLLF